MLGGGAEMLHWGHGDRGHTSQTTAGLQVPTAQCPLLPLRVLKVFLQGFLILSY